MIIYEKENKLNINFDNSIEAEPDVVISKEDEQVNIEAGGQPIGGGANVLTLYLGLKDDSRWLYKDPEFTQEYASYEEAVTAIKAASTIKVFMNEDITLDSFTYLLPIVVSATVGQFHAESVMVGVYADANTLIQAFLWKKEGQMH